MKAKYIQAYNITLQDLEEALRRIIKESAPAVSSPNNILTRQQVMELLDITPVTLRNWSKSGKLQGHNLEGRVYYKYGEIEKALVPQKNHKSRRGE